jgi:hypothetical protein
MSCDEKRKKTRRVHVVLEISLDYLNKSLRQVASAVADMMSEPSSRSSSASEELSIGIIENVIFAEIEVSTRWALDSGHSITNSLCGSQCFTICLMRRPSRYQTLLTTEAESETLFTAGQAYASATREATLDGGPPRLDLLLRPQSATRK